MQEKLDAFLVHVTFILLTDEWARLEVGAIFFHQNNCMGGILKIWKYASRCLCFYPEIVVISALVSEACLWEVTVNVETITGTENKATVKCLAPDGTSRASLPRPREHCGRLNEKNVRARGWGGRDVEHCLQDMTWTFHLWTHSSCAYLYKMSASHIEWDRAHETLLLFLFLLAMGS